MKKKLSILLSSLLTLSILATGCAASSKKEETTSAAKDTKAQEVKVGFVYSGPITDKGYVYAHDLGRQAIERELGVKTIYKESVKEDKAEVKAAIDNLIQQGANVIFTTSFGFMDATEAAAKEYPEVKFLHSAGYKSNGTNFVNYFGKMEEPRYLAGIAAGLKTKSNKIGFVAAFAIPEVIRGIDAFALGVQSVNPNAVVKVTWTNTWYDPAKEKEAAKALMDQGVDVLAQHQNAPAVQQAAEERGIFSVGYNLDMAEYAPKAYMTGAVWNWGAYYVEKVKEIKEGKWEAKNYLGGMKEGIVQLAPLTANAPAEAKDKIAKAQADIEAGKFHVFTGPLKDQTGAVKVEAGKVLTDEEVLKIDYLIQGVEGTIKK
jgi:basic membrane protein A